LSIQKLLDIGAIPNMMSCSSGSLQLAVHRHDEEIINILLHAGANINLQTESGITPLMEASFIGDFKIVKKLVELGADTNITTIDDLPRTALVCAAEYKHQKVFDYLFPLTHSKQQKDLATSYLTED
jgi:ankyrin repeat protein